MREQLPHPGSVGLGGEAPGFHPLSQRIEGLQVLVPHRLDLVQPGGVGRLD